MELKGPDSLAYHRLSRTVDASIRLELIYSVGTFKYYDPHAKKGTTSLCNKISSVASRMNLFFCLGTPNILWHMWHTPHAKILALIAGKVHQPLHPPPPKSPPNHGVWMEHWLCLLLARWRTISVNVASYTRCHWIIYHNQLVIFAIAANWENGEVWIFLMS